MFSLCVSNQVRLLRFKGDLVQCTDPFLCLVNGHDTSNIVDLDEFDGNGIHVKSMNEIMRKNARCTIETCMLIGLA